MADHVPMEDDPAAGAGSKLPPLPAQTGASGLPPISAAAAAAAVAPLKGGGARNQKRKTVKHTKAAGAGPKAGGADRSAGGGNAGAARSSKKKTKEEVVFDASDLTQPLPNNLRVFCLSLMTNRYHEARVLERRQRDDKFKIQSVPWPPSPHPPLPPPPEGAQPDFAGHKFIYYIHYLEWDRRMDEWVYRDRLCLPAQLHLLQPPSFNIPTAGAAGSGDAKDDAPAASAGGKEKKDDDDEGDDDEKDDVGANAKKKGDSIKGKGKGKGKGKDLSGVGAATIPGGDPHGGSLGGHGNFSEEDIKAHEEATKVKNVESIVVGKYHMSTWYYSPLPAEYSSFNVLHFCEFCLNFFGYEEELKRHSRKCLLRHPPGNEIYRSDEKNVRVAVFEVDGAREKVYCQNLCYIAKLFLDHKTLEFDCTPFLFYIFCEVDETGYHIVGYFSKEKISQSKYNLACILTLPCHQRKGYGRLIISLSYELSKIERKVGSPEKPISDLGKVSYMSYWSNTLLSELEMIQTGGGSGSRKDAQPISIEQLSIKTCITTDDIVECLKALHILRWSQGRWVLSEQELQRCLQERAEKEKRAQEKREKNPHALWVRECQKHKLHWTPFFVDKKLAKLHGAI